MCVQGQICVQLCTCGGHAKTSCHTTDCHHRHPNSPGPGLAKPQSFKTPALSSSFSKHNPHKLPPQPEPGADTGWALPGSECLGAGGLLAAGVWLSRRSRPSRTGRGSRSPGTCSAQAGRRVSGRLAPRLPLLSSPAPPLTAHPSALSLPHKCTKFSYVKKSIS